MIELRQVSKSLPSGGQPLAILRPLDVSIPAGQFVTVMGPSGSGKSTLLGLIAGLDTPSAGTITVNGHEITRMNEDELARFRGHTIGFVFQTFQLIPTLTALENVMVPLEIARQPDAGTRAEALLALVGLSGRGSHYPAQLSGGEQQRVAIARAFACRPPVLLADEPTGNLDSANGAHVLDLLGRLHRDERTTIVLVTHDPDVARRADRVIHLRDGAVVNDLLSGNGAGGRA
jgi:putative ABC transport system ATP-binding protein